MTQLTETPAGAGRPPGRPRSERAEKAILAATLDLLAEAAGVDAVSIEAVAAQAGVGKTTIYRRWSGKEALIVDALAAAKPPFPELAGRSVRDDLLTVAAAMGREQGARHTRCYWNVLAASQKYPGLLDRYQREVLDPRRAAIRAVLRRGVATGELRAGLDVEAAITMMVGAATMAARSLPAVPVRGDYAALVVDYLLHGIEARES